MDHRAEYTHHCRHCGDPIRRVVVDGPWVTRYGQECWGPYGDTAKVAGKHQPKTNGAP